MRRQSGAKRAKRRGPFFLEGAETRIATAVQPLRKSVRSPVESLRTGVAPLRLDSGLILARHRRKGIAVLLTSLVTRTATTPRLSWPPSPPQVAAISSANLGCPGRAARKPGIAGSSCSTAAVDMQWNNAANWSGGTGTNGTPGRKTTMSQSATWAAARLRFPAPAWRFTA